MYDLIRADRFEEAKAALPKDDDATLMAYSLMVNSSKDYELQTYRSVSMLAGWIFPISAADCKDRLLVTISSPCFTSTDYYSSSESANTGFLSR